MEQKKPKTKKQKPDIYKNLKYLGHCMSQLPDPYTLSDLLRYAKFQLAQKTNRLMKDPIWDLYTAEELLVEFFALQMDTNEKFRMKFEQEWGTGDAAVDDFAAWADKQMAEEAKIRDRVMGEMEDKVVFDPKDVMGDG